jgi:CRP/FNR family transcriptional regulator
MSKISKPDSCIACPNKWKHLSLLNEDDIKLMQNSCRIIHFKKGETICKQGTDAGHSIYLAKGVVKLYIEGKKNLILKLIKAGNYIDLQTLFGDKKYKFSVSAVEDSMVCMIQSDLMIDLSKRNPSFLFELTKTISDSGNYFYKKVKDISQKQLRGRLADTLIYLSEEIYESDDFNLTITRKEIAELSSMSMENAVRIMSELSKDGVISVQAKKIQILEPQILKKLSDIG